MSKSEQLWQISIVTSTEAEEAVAALLERLFGQKTSVYTPDESTVSTVTVFSKQSARAKEQALNAGLKFITDSGLNVSPGKISMGKVPRENWSESWKKHFKIIEIGSALLIKPSWSKRKPKKHQELIILDPGLSFGTGQHPTTYFCLEQLVRYRNRKAPLAFLDLGTGSGILAIAAAKLGYKPVTAIDHDPQALRIARNNARRNGVQDLITFRRKELQTLPLKKDQDYHLICANLTADLLVKQERRILNLLKQDGILVLAGILAGQFAEVAGVYKRAGLELVESRVDQEWKSGVFTTCEPVEKGELG